MCVCVCSSTQGKSLSLICGALSWLTDHEEQSRQKAAALLHEGQLVLSTSTAASSAASGSAEPDWITEFVQKKAERDLVSKLKVRSINASQVDPRELWHLTFVVCLFCESRKTN